MVFESTTDFSTSHSALLCAGLELISSQCTAKKLQCCKETVSCNFVQKSQNFLPKEYRATKSHTSSRIFAVERWRIIHNICAQHVTPSVISMMSEQSGFRRTQYIWYWYLCLPKLLQSVKGGLMRLPRRVFPDQKSSPSVQLTVHRQKQTLP